MILILKNTVSNKEYTFAVTDKADTRLFYHFSIVLEGDMPDGEYEYTLIETIKGDIQDTDVVRATGVLQIGDYEVERTQYNKTNNTYIQYNG